MLKIPDFEARKEELETLCGTALIQYKLACEPKKKKQPKVFAPTNASLYYRHKC